MATNYCVYEPGTKEVLRGAFGLVILEYKAPDINEPWLDALFDEPFRPGDHREDYHWQACLIDNDRIAAMATGKFTTDAVSNLYREVAEHAAWEDHLKLYH